MIAVLGKFYYAILARESPRYYCRSWTLVVLGNVMFGTVSHGESIRANREYGRAFPHTFVISRAHTHEYIASISVFTIPLEHARAYDVRTSVNLATASTARIPRVPGSKGRRGAPVARASLDYLPTYLPTPLLVFMLTGRLY